MDVFDLQASITLDSSKYEAGLESASEKTSMFGDMLKANLAAEAVTKGLELLIQGIGKIATAFPAALTATAEFGDNIDKMSQKMGMSATAYQEWDAVMQHSGTSMETLKASMKTLATAAETGKDAFDRLGISQQQIAEMSQEELFSATITALQNVTDETERTYLAGQTLGRGATELGALLNTSAEETQAMKDRVHELGGVMSDEGVKASARFQDSLQDMGTAIEGAKRSLVEGFLPAMSDIMDGIGNVVSGFDVEGGLQQIEQGVDNFVNNLNDVVPRLAELAARIIPAFAKAIVTNLPTLAQTGLDVILSLANGIANHIPELLARLPAIIVGIVNFITSNLPAIIQTGVNIIIAIIQGLAQALPQLIAAAPQIIMAIAQGILQSLIILWENGPAIVEAIGEGIKAALGTLKDIGVSILRAIVEGMASALGWVGDMIVGLFSDTESKGTAAAEHSGKTTGETYGKAVASGAESQSGTVNKALGDLMDKGNALVASKASEFGASTGTIPQYMGNSVSGNASAFFSSIDYTMGGAVKTAEGWAPQFSSPGISSMDYLGSGFASGDQIAGYVNTSMSGALSAGEAAAVMFGSVGDSMVNQTVSHIAASAQAVSGAARGVVVTAFTVANAATSVFSSVGSNIARGIAAGINSGTGFVVAAVQRIIAAAKAAAKAAAAIASPSKLFRDEVGYFMGLGVAKGLEDSEDEATKAAVKLAQDTYSKAKEWIRRYAKFNDLSLSGQIEVWETIQSQFVAGSQQFLDAEEEIFDLRKSKEEKAFSDQETMLNKLTRRWNLSISKQITAWTQAQKQYAKGSEYWMEIEEKLIDLRLEARQEYAQKVEEVDKNIVALEDNYAKQLESRMSQIAGAYKLFDDVQDRYKVSGQELTTNLTRQVNVLHDFYDGLEALSARGVSEALVDEIRAMGPEAVDNLDALLAMTDKELEKYAALYEEKQQYANEVALKELAGLRDETNEQILDNLDSLKALYDQNAPYIGKAFTDGLTEGIQRGMSSVINAANAVATAAVRAAKSTLGIASPSKVFAKIGEQMTAGLAVGWGDSIGDVTRQIGKTMEFDAGTVDFARSGLGLSSAGVINGIAQQAGGASGGTYNLNLVTPDGSVMARWVFDPLKAYASSMGTPIVNPT